MPQIHQVLKCYSCETFQAHIVKKVNTKWQCKICNEKQSIKKVYGQGRGKDCRLHVQKLNALRANNENTEIEFTTAPILEEASGYTRTYSNLEEELESEDSMDINKELYDNLDSLNNVNKNKENRYFKQIYSPSHNADTHSKWTKYLDEDDLNKFRIGNNLNRSDLYEKDSSSKPKTDEFLSNFSSNINNKTNNNSNSNFNCFESLTNDESLDEILQL